MSRYVTLTPSKSPTVAAVGEFAYKEALRRAPSGEVMLEVVPEPDNPHDSRAISIRHNGNVIGYIPRDRTSTYWPVVARVAASGKIARVKGKIYGNKATDFYEVSLHLLSGDKALGSAAGLVPKAPNYAVPNAYKATGSATPTPSSGVTFTKAEVDAEIARRRRDNPTSTPRTQSPAEGGAKDNSNLGCGLVALIVFIIIVIAL